MFRNKDSTGTIGKWAVELAPFEINFTARTAIKSQVIADFIAEWTPSAIWSPETPSEDKSFQAWHPDLAQYLAEVRKAELAFKGISIRSILRGENHQADALTKAAARGQELPAGAFYEEIHTSSATKLTAVEVLCVDEDWRSPIMARLLSEGANLDGPNYARLKRRIHNYHIIGGSLYKSGVCAPLLRCIPASEGQVLLRNIHEGLCGSHLALRLLAGKTLRQGLYWPTIMADAKALVRTCQGCQWMGRRSHQLSTPLQVIAPVWPLAQWGMNLIGPFPHAKGNLKFAVVAVEYFSKLVKAEPLTAITSKNVQKFFRQNIICRFGVPKQLTIDNGTQFDAEPFREFCEGLGIELCFVAVRHPQSNGAVERANSNILVGLNRRIVGLAKGLWVDELPKILWSIWTIQSRSTGFTLFRLLFGDEAMTPTELKGGSLRTILPEATNEREVLLNLSEETCLRAVVNLTKYQAQTKTWFDPKK
ncbi:hypothetical protein ABZP36_010715 [Zizania latifolia]